jgi:hypothetical protein
VSLCVGGWVLVVSGMLVRRSDMGSVVRRRSDLAAQTEQFEDEEPNPVGAFPQLRCLGLRFVTVGHPNLVGLIGVPRPSTHRQNGTRTMAVGALTSALPRLENPCQVPTVMERIVGIGRHDISEFHGPAR